MNLEQVAQFVKNPALLTLSHADSLKSLAEKHPFTSIYPLLYLTALSNGKSTDLEEALKQFAYRIPDRTRLYHLLTAGGIQVEIVERVEHVEEAKAVEKVETVEKIEETSVIEAFTPEETISRELSTPEPEVQRKTEAEIGFDFEKVTTAHSLEQFLELDEKAAAENVQGPETSEEPETPINVQSAEPQIKSFTSWLKSSGPTPVQPTETPAKTSANDLIERFIKEEPSISRNKTEFYSPSKKAKESLNESVIPVSETLAKIYAAQGNYPKAIHVYHQLMLSIPEKKSFFAIQIEELKKKITS